ncbi:MAG: alpha-amylase family glycosyl hydrolase [Lachnospiraceae bacterium]
MTVTETVLEIFRELSVSWIYLQELGIGAIWISPFNDSPNYDNGYDISDYYAILKDFGTMADLEEMIQECEKREISLL